MNENTQGKTFAELTDAYMAAGTGEFESARFELEAAISRGAGTWPEVCRLWAARPTRLEMKIGMAQQRLREIGARLAKVDEAWTTYTAALQAVMDAPVNATRDDFERLWLAAELAANTVRRLAEVER